MTNPTRPRLIWRISKLDRGMTSSIQASRELRYVGTPVAYVVPNMCGFHECDGWHWYTFENKQLGIKWKNTTAESPPEIFATRALAEASCKKYILGELMRISIKKGKIP